MLQKTFFARKADKVALGLLGKILCRRIGRNVLKGKIVETEAYFGLGDPASHAFRGPTPRSKIMFGPPGFVYVYFTYGNHWMLNIVTEKDGKPGAVLIRALEPLDGMDIMRKNRGRDELTNGPARLTEAFGIDGRMNGTELGKDIWVEDGRIEEKIGKSGRIGIRAGTKELLRFFVKGNKWVSKQVF